MESAHPIETYQQLIKSIQAHVELEELLGFKELPPLGDPQQIPPALEIEPEEDLPIIPVYPKTVKQKETERLPKSEVVKQARLSLATKQEGLSKLAKQVASCTSCRLASTRIKTVFGAGNPNAELIFIGEAPGADEDREGLPFVGKAGQLLTRIIEAIQLTREDVYIMNLIKCRPPGNREPKLDEVELCRPFLLSQLNFLDPKVICTLGRYASHYLLETTTPISKIRGKTFYWKEIPVVPTFHPSYLLRNESEKRKVWEDMKKIRDLLKSLSDSP
jgi:uracil-DNA glycosylase family 4